MKMDGSFLNKKPSFKMLGLIFSSKLDWGFHIASKKIGAFIPSMKFLSPEIALWLYKSTIQSCIEYCCNVWAGAPSCYLELLEKLQKQICRTVGSLATSNEPLVHRRNVASLSSLIYLMHMIGHAHASICATSLMCTKIASATSVYDLLSETLEWRNERTKTSYWITDHFSLTCANQLRCCTSMYDFKLTRIFKFGGNTIISLDINVPLYLS